jgi:hypothetical protein
MTAFGMGFVVIGLETFQRGINMTFSVVQIEEGTQRIVGTVWANDESGARALAPVFFPSDVESNLSIQRDDDREIPLRMDAAAEPFH